MSVNACRQAVLAEVEAYTARCDRPVATVHNVSPELLGVFTAAMFDGGGWHSSLDDLDETLDDLDARGAWPGGQSVQ
jgi:hypothetical protein